MGSSFLSEVHYASDQEGAPRPVTSYLLLPPLPQVTLPRSGYRGSDFVPWHKADYFGSAATRHLSCRYRSGACLGRPLASDRRRWLFVMFKTANLVGGYVAT